MHGFEKTLWSTFYLIKYLRVHFLRKQKQPAMINTLWLYFLIHFFLLNILFNE